MPCNLFPSYYEKLVEEDIEWLKENIPDDNSLELNHIINILRFSVREYRLRGYNEAMSKTGPHYES